VIGMLILLASKINLSSISPGPQGSNYTYSGFHSGMSLTKISKVYFGLTVRNDEEM
jgi:hypothetical protein